MYAYKLVTQDMKTRSGYSNEVTWEIGKKVVANGDGTDLCSPDVIHSYASPLLAVLLNPIHANLNNPRLFKARCTKVIATDDLKQGHKSMTLVSEMDLPEITLNQRIAFAILCSLEETQSEAYLIWANNWLSGRDRSYAARAAGHAASAAAYAASAVRAAASAANAASAADAASHAAHAAASAASAARAISNNKIDFARLAEKALCY